MRRQQSNKPMRRCIGCYNSFPQEELLRFTYKDGNIIADDGEKKDGRGFYLCNNRECLDRALKKKALNRILKSNVDPDTIRQVIDALNNNTKED